MKPPQQRCTGALLVLAALAALGSWWFAELQYQALSYRPDFGFYHQFAARAANPELADRQSFNVAGDNMFGIIGREGEDGLHQAMHFEPIKYLDVLALRLGGGVALMFLWRALVHAVPLLVLALAARRSERPVLLLLAGLAYITFPSFLYHATFDLRPYQFVGPALFALYVAIHQRLSAAVVMACLLVALLAREEAVWLSSFAVVFLRLWSPERRGLFRAAATLIGTWLLLVLGYMAWTGYEVSRSAVGNLVLALAYLGSILGPLVLARLPATENRLHRWAELAAILGPAAVVTAALVRSRWLHDLGWLYFALHPRPFIVIPVAVVVLLWLSRERPRLARAGLGSTIVFSLLVHGLSPAAPLRRAGALEERSRSAALVFLERERLDPLRTRVLCDRATCQTFADFEHAFHFNSIFGEAGFPKRGPESEPLATWLEQFERIVVESDNLARLRTSGFRDATGWSNVERGEFVVVRRE